MTSCVKHRYTSNC